MFVINNTTTKDEKISGNVYNEIKIIKTKNYLITLKIKWHL